MSRDTRTMLRLLVQTLGTAGAGATLAGCCEVISLGWSSYRGPRASYAVRVAETASLAGEEVDDDGWFDDGVCDQACGDNDGCTVSEMTVPLNDTTLSCTFSLEGHLDERESFHGVPEGLDVSSLQDGHALPLEHCDCGQRITSCRVNKPKPLPSTQRYVVCRYVTPGGCHSSLPAGRFPHTLTRRDRPVVASLGALYARAAEDEAAAITAFVILARELRSFGASPRLVAAARSAARDEARHAKLMSRLARRHGGHARPINVRHPRDRDIFEVALENAREGLAGESVGALLALHQARHAADPRTRRSLRSIAIDEARHAALAWQVHDFCMPRLTPSQRARVGDAFRERWAALRHAHFAPPEIRVAAGLPDPERQAELLATLRARLAVA